jgi:transcriptional regulator with GAF, ATPase, and Fis domain
VLGQSRAILDVLNEARFVASTDFTVLLTGESGVGKGLLAHFIHEHSPRRQRKMASLNCAGVPESRLAAELFGDVRGSFGDRAGLFAMASSSTLLLDEVGEMGARIQARLVNVLDETPDVRIISATSRDLLQGTSGRAFRVDLYYRLNVAHLQIPPLRERREDIALLMAYQLKILSERFRLPLCELDQSAVATLEAYRWPGNIRELRGVAEFLALTHAGRVVAVSELPATVLEQRGSRPPIEAAPVPRHGADAVATACYEQITQGLESFWTVVHEPFIAGKLTREAVRAVITRGLRQTNGSYKALTILFNLPPTDRRRFLDFLQQHNCHPRPRAVRAATRATVRVKSLPRRNAAV